MKMKYLILSDIENWYIKCHLISLPIFMATMKGHGLLALLEWKECPVGRGIIGKEPL